MMMMMIMMILIACQVTLTQEDFKVIVIESTRSDFHPSGLTKM